jgi:hypothetical protein
MNDDFIDIDEAIAVNIAWSSSGWRGPSENPVDWQDASFENVRKAEHAHEWWNFDVDHPANADGYVYGYFNFAGDGSPRIGADEKVAVVFVSSSPHDGEMYIVGVYLGAEYSEHGWPGVEEKGEDDKTSWSKLRCRHENVWVAEPKMLLRLDNRRHLKGKSVGRRGMTYIEPKHLRRVLKDLTDAQNERATRFLMRTRMT